MYFTRVDTLITYDKLFLIPLLASAVLSLRAFYQGWSPPFRFFSVFLVIACFTEWFSLAWVRWLYKTEFWEFPQSNYWLYGLYFMVGFPFLMYFLTRLSQYTLSKKIGYLLVSVYFIFSFINYFFIQTLHEINTYNLILASISFIVLAALFFRHLLNKKEIIKLSDTAEVWIAAATFIYYLGATPLNMSLHYLTINNETTALILLNITYTLNILLYTSYAIAFLCKPKILI